MVLGYFNPLEKRTQKISVGKYTSEGIEKNVVVEVGHPGRHNYRVWAEPTTKGKNTKLYHEIRDQLGDVWSSDITDTWYEPRNLPVKLQNKINEIIEEVRKEGYTRY